MSGAVCAQSSGAQSARAAGRFDPARLPISPGMAAQVEISEADQSSIRWIDVPPNGRRSVVSADACASALSPIARATNEAGRGGSGEKCSAESFSRCSCGCGV